VAGRATCSGAQYDASSWLEPIIEPDRWERLTEMLTDPARRTNPHNANAPRWLLSGHAQCGICGDGSTMHASGMGGYGPERGSAYRCDKGSHCATPAMRGAVSFRLRLRRDTCAAHQHAAAAFADRVAARPG
jgi:hypothetical protein